MDFSDLAEIVCQNENPQLPYFLPSVPRVKISEESKNLALILLTWEELSASLYTPKTASCAYVCRLFIENFNPRLIYPSNQ